ncbi:hypothetical protein RND81_08G036400 [Saponaria officinalis]|uniref:Pectinesterase n=1 Tax=Saponaria officinalis TaxID=3572 RepID=A0AAW1J3J6_SAPOF
MASTLSKHIVLQLLLLIIFTFLLTQSTSALKNYSQNLNVLQIQSLCKTTPYPNECINSLKLSISITIPKTLLNLILNTVENAIVEVTKVSSLLATTTQYNLIEKQRGVVLDCKELHQISLNALKKTLSRVKTSKISDARAFLSGALTNKDTCLEGLASSSGPRKSALVTSLVDSYKHVSNSLSMLSNNPRRAPQNHNRRLLVGPPRYKHVSNSLSMLSNNPRRAPQKHNRRLLVGLPRWLSRKDRKILQYDDYGGGDDNDDGSENIIVALDGSGNFTSVQEAINFAPNNSEYRTFIYVKKGIYNENVEIPSYKINIVLLGDGRDVTLITSNRSVDDGWTTFRSATLAVSADGFLARDIAFENTAGPEKHQAVALRISADLVAIYRCTIKGYQDTLYVHSFRQFYRECDIYGTIDYIFGNAAVVFQGCNIVTRMPLPGQFTTVTAQSRDMPEENTGISIQNCTVLATEWLYSNKTKVKSYLGRPWRTYSRTVFIESYIDDFIDPAGWTKWSDDNGLDTLYYGEYGNQGPGSLTDNRVNWKGYHVMEYDEASNFTVSQFIVGNEWLDSTSFPYDDSI